MLSLEKLSVKYSSTGRAAVEGLSLDLEPGERLALLGPSGCGKTTVLKAILGLLRREEASLEGRISRGGAGIAAVLQRPALFPWLSVRSNIAFPLLASGRSSRGEIEAVTDPLLRIGGLEDWAARLPRELSAGMQQRASFLRALAASPELIVMDEPFSSLDVAVKERLMRDFLSILKARPVTVLFVTHDIGEALAMGDRVVVLTAAPGREKARYDLKGLGASERGKLRAALEAEYEN